MRFKSLTVAGAIPFPDTTTINFPNATTVTLTGDNGAGKSTLLDCIYAALYGDLTKPGSLYTLFADNPKGVIDLTFEMRGHTYQIKRLINGVSRSQKPYFYCDGVTLTEGKADQFKQMIALHVGLSPEAFLAGVYNAQTGKGNPLALGDKERRGLLSEILGLDQFDHPLEVVSSELKAAETRLIGYIATREQLQNSIGDLNLLESKKAELANSAIAAKAALAAKNDEIQKLRQDLANANANAQGLDEVRRQITNLETEILTDEKTIGDLDARIAKNRSDLLDRADAINQAVIETDAITHQRDDLSLQCQILANERDRLESEHRGKVGELTAQSDAANQAWLATSADLRAATQSAQEAQRKLSTLTAEIAALEPSVETLDRVPCKGQPIHETCELLAQARSAAASIAVKKEQFPFAAVTHEAAAKKVAELEAVAGEQSQQMEALRNQVKELSQQDPAAEVKVKIKDLDQRISESVGRIQALAPLVKLQPDLMGAQDRIAQYQMDAGTIAARLNVNRPALAGLRQKLADAQALDETTNRLNAAIKGVETEIAVLSGEVEGLTKRQAEVEFKLQQAESIKGQLAELETNDKYARERAAYLQFLKEGLGGKGARALKIDNAGPEISELVNTLLRECYGSRFTIQINTLRTLASDADQVRECLEFSIIDNETGNETPVENKSGGEQQLIREVISLALCIYQRIKAGIDTRTIIRDESCSALTEANTELYVKMLRTACKIGGFDQVIYVSHKSCAQSMADAVIHVGRGKVEVQAA